MTSVCVFTGFVGAGKTTIILDIIKRLNLKTALIKNEFGDAAVDSLLFKQKNVQVEEFENGCLCCVMVGKLQSALFELQKSKPDIIFVECSGSAFPATIAMQIKDLGFMLESIVNVIDCENFSGYKDTSVAARMQAAYTDVILMNKWDLVSEDDYERVLDHVLELNLDTPRFKYHKNLNLDVVFTSRGKPEPQNLDHQDADFEHFTLTPSPISKSQMQNFLDSLSKDVYRIKASINLDGKDYVINHAFGRYKMIELKVENYKITVMGRNILNVKLKLVNMFKFYS